MAKKLSTENVKLGVDIDGDGKTEVVTYSKGVRSVWNSRNELVL